MEMKEITILRRKIEATPRLKGQLKGLTVGEKLSYNFYDGSYNGNSLLFLEPKKGNPTPKECQITADRISGLFGMPVVFILSPGPTFERQRLADKGVYFIMSDQYAHLPMLIALEKTTDRKKATSLTPVAQYILLYHLQECSLEGLSVKEIAARIPYSYESAALGVTCLEDLGLGKKERQGLKERILHFELKGRELWDNAQPFLSSPVVQRLYCDGIHSDAKYPICGINALSHYSRLNPDREGIWMLTDKEYRSLKKSESLDSPNEYDGDIALEIWKYPAVGPIVEIPQYVDRLSLALALKEDDDPRVEEEIERVINEMQWKG